MAENVGDHWARCPSEWSPLSSVKTATWMADYYGVLIALKRASRHRLNYDQDTWGRKHWDLVIRRLKLKT